MGYNIVTEVARMNKIQRHLSKFSSKGRTPLHFSEEQKHFLDMLELISLPFPYIKESSSPAWMFRLANKHSRGTTESTRTGTTVKFGSQEWLI